MSRTHIRLASISVRVHVEGGTRGPIEVSIGGFSATRVRATNVRLGGFHLGGPATGADSDPAIDRPSDPDPCQQPGCPCCQAHRQALDPDFCTN